MEGLIWSARTFQPTRRIRIIYRSLKAWTKGQHLLRSWQNSVSFWAILTGVVLSVNLALTIWIGSSFPIMGGVATLFEGSCSKASTWNTWIHIGINVLSILLLSASNYTMQCLGSPTREEIDEAHANARWLDVGVPTARNLTSISRRRAIVWLLLAITSVPLALLYNSMVFKAYDSNDYTSLLVTDGFLNQTKHNVAAINYGYMNRFFMAGQEYSEGKAIEPGLLNSHPDSPIPYVATRLQGTIGRLEYLNTEECVQKYTKRILSGRRNLLLITTNHTTNPPAHIGADIFGFEDVLLSTRFSFSGGPDPLGFMCSGLWGFNELSYPPWPTDCRADMLDAANWTVRGYKIDYCLSERTKERCRLEFSVIIGIVIVTCNAVKLGCMIHVAFMGNASTLCTLGDVIESFLNQPDPTTAGACLMSNKDVCSGQWAPKAALLGTRSTKAYHPQRKHWFSRADILRWHILTIGVVGTLITSVWLLHIGIVRLKSSMSVSVKSLWTLGFGSVDPQSLLRLPSDYSNKEVLAIPSPVNLLAVVLIANLPQGVLSMLHLSYNGLFTCMLMEKEWSDFVYQRRPLRVSSPTGDQVSTYYLQLPLRYAGPLIFLSGLIHWLVSESVFLARIIVYDVDGIEDHSASVNTCGYSCIAIIFAIIVGGSMLIGIFCMGARSFRPGIPLAGHCSAVISAACHRIPEEANASRLPLMWGVTGTKDGVGHCTFSGRAVSLPTEGQQLA